MPEYIIKPNRDIDLYVGWSTVVDNVTWIAEGEEVRNTPDSSIQGADWSLRVDRADANGSSDYINYGWWNRSDFLVHNLRSGRIERGCGLLRRDHMLLYAILLLSNNVEAAEMLVDELPDWD